MANMWTEITARKVKEPQAMVANWKTATALALASI